MLKFKGQWRTYQKRVLDQSSQYLKDKKIHIVAAPGSGKTTLGIELIGRLHAPALILSPSINIRNQWLKRIQEAFLPDGIDINGILSDDIREPAMITAITYQALHSCMHQRKEEEQENSSFDIFETIKKVGIQTLCLDEAHHLRSEWWKAVEELVDREKELTIISLTATPPYDATKTEWERYIGLCGPIDEEIIVPELVKEKSLCPHQDYVYFNMPTEEEAEAVLEFRENAMLVAKQIFLDDEFAQKIASHVGIRNPSLYADQLLEHPKYLSSLLVFLNAKLLPFSKELLYMMGTKEKIPAMSLKWLEIMLQGFLYDDIESFDVTEEYRENLTHLLKSHNLIYRKKVCFTANEEIDQLITRSKGKIRSIVTIVEEEYHNLGSDLRLLILTDYIKKEYLSCLGNPNKSVHDLGVVPIFENIRRAYEIQNSVRDSEVENHRPTDRDLRMAMLSGTVVLIPESAKTVLENLMEENGITGNMKESGAKGYYLVTVSGTEETASGLLTKLFNQGEIRVLIGTKSLLGEGWDSPCINTLILASFVGSFMLSNQMRGRAIRTMKENPNKVSNIWHLICMEPENNTVGQGMMESPEESEDFATLKRRFQGFMGVHYEENVVESGFDRLSCIQPPYTKEALENINEKMLFMAANRDGLKEKWEKSVVDIKNMDVAVETGVEQECLKPGFRLVHAWVRFVMVMIATGACLVGVVIPFLISIFSGNEMKKMTIMGAISVGVCLFLLYRYGARLLGMITPERYLKSIGTGVLQALKEIGEISSKDVYVKEEKGDGTCSYLCLRGGTEREKDVFAQCMYEMFAPVDNQRYLCVAKHNVPRLCKYYCIPEIFGRKKEAAYLFLSCISKTIGAYDLIYTRNGEGRRILLEARIQSFANKNEQCVETRKRIKGD